jgi:hypothetical protein
MSLSLNLIRRSQREPVSSFKKLELHNEQTMDGLSLRDEDEDMALLDEEDEDDDEEEEEEEDEEGARNFAASGKHFSTIKTGADKRPGPRRKSCPWCNNRKCTHCRCESFARCDHTSNEPCKRERYGRRLVCNTCERNKLKDSCSKKPRKERKTSSKNKKTITAGLFSPVIKAPTSSTSHIFGKDNKLKLNLSLPSTSITNPPLGVAISAAAQQNALMAAINVMNRNKPQINIAAIQEEQECFDMALQSLMSTSTTPTSLSGLNMPLSPLLGGLQFSFFPPNQSPLITTSYSPPTTPLPSVVVDPSSFLDLMSSVDYYNDIFTNNATTSYPSTKNQPMCESDCGLESPHSSKSDELVSAVLGKAVGENKAKETKSSMGTSVSSQQSMLRL